MPNPTITVFRSLRSLQRYALAALLLVTLLLFTTCWYQQRDIACLSRERDIALSRQNARQQKPKPKPKPSPTPAPVSLNNSIVSAAEGGDLTQVESLLKHGANINGEGLQFCYGNAIWTPLMAAVSSQQTKMVEYLLAHGANVNYATTGMTSDGGAGESALLIAARRENLEMMRLLLHHGADVFHENSHGCNAMFEAISTGSLPAVKMLIANGMTVTDRSSQQAMQWLVFDCTDRPHDKHTILLKYLLDQGANPNGRGMEREGHDYTLLMHACGAAYGHEAVAQLSPTAVRILLAYGANPNLRDRYGKDAMDYVRECASYNDPVFDKEFHYHAYSRIIIRLLKKSGAS